MSLGTVERYDFTQYPNANQINAFARVLHQDTGISIDVLSPPAVIVAWRSMVGNDCPTADEIDALTDRMDWTDPERVGRLASLKLKVVIDRESSGLTRGLQ